MWCRRIKERVYCCREYNVHNMHTNNIVEQYNKMRAIYYLLTRILFLIWLVGSRTTMLHRTIPVLDKELHGGVCGEPVFFFVMLFRKNGVSNLSGKGLHELIHLLLHGFPEFPNQVLLMSQALELIIAVPHLFKFYMPFWRRDVSNLLGRALLGYSMVFGSFPINCRIPPPPPPFNNLYLYSQNIEHFIE